MTSPTPAELKRKLRAAAFEIYRTTANQVLLAERIRDNLIMDSGVSAKVQSDALSVEVVVTAQASHFPGADEAQIWQHAKNLASEFLRANYTEESTNSESLPDPSDPSLSLDTRYEIRLSRAVTSVEALMDELRAALAKRRSTADD